MLQMRLNHSLIYKKVILYRIVNQKVRYYSLQLRPTLFKEIMLTREYGSLNNKKPTRVIKEYFSSMENSIRALERLIRLKKRRGYD